MEGRCPFVVDWCVGEVFHRCRVILLFRGRGGMLPVKGEEKLVCYMFVIYCKTLSGGFASMMVNLVSLLFSD